MCLLAGTETVELLEHDKEVVGQREVGIKLVAHVEVVHGVLSQVVGNEADAKRTLARALMADEDGNGLVAVEGVELQPVGHHGAMPDAAPIDLLGGDARDAAVEFGEAIDAVPLRQVVEPLFHGVEEGRRHRADVEMDDGSGITFADTRAARLEDDAVERSVVEHLPAVASAGAVGGIKGEKLVLFVQDIVAEHVVLLEEGFGAKGVFLTVGCDGHTMIGLVGGEGQKIVVFLYHKI